MDSEAAALDRTYALLREQVAPKAQIIDRDVEALREVLSQFCEQNLMALKRPEEYGGPAVGEEGFRKFQEEIARTSGVFAFLQTQHQSAVSMISSSRNEVLRQEYLPMMGDGRKLVGIGFSQLRRGGPPIMTAKETEGGYILDGSVPWITGWSFYPEFVVGATLPDGRALFAIAPLVDTEDGGTVKISPPMRLAAMEAAMTVSAQFESFFVPDSRVLFIREAGWIRNNDMINIALQGHFALGCAQAGIDIVGMNAEKKGLPFLQQAKEALERELAECHEATAEAQKSVDEQTTDERLRVRAWAIDLAVRCAHAAVASSSGAANSIDHPAQRVYREALVYTVSAQTTQIMEGTLRRLVERC